MNSTDPEPTPEAAEDCGLYAHIPWCVVRCAYCDFYSQVGGEENSPRYLDALARDVRSFPDRTGYRPAVATIFLGGGTPSMADPEAIARLLDAIRAAFPVREGCETTIEANPESLDEEKVDLWASAGINRISLGVQSLRDRHLSALGRPHDAARALAALACARRGPVATLSADFIYGLPGQSAREWREDLARIADLGVDHISAYLLETEKDTPLARRMAAGNVPEPDPGEVADQWEATGVALEAAGYRRYEISNFARPGKECRHNLVYWTDRPFLGFGASSHGYWRGRRTAVTLSALDYIATVERGEETMGEIEAWDPDRRLAEAIVTGLRLTDGCDFTVLSRRYGRDLFTLHRRALADEAGLGRLVIEGSRVRLSPTGMLFSNDVLCRFV